MFSIIRSLRAWLAAPALALLLLGACGDDDTTTPGTTTTDPSGLVDDDTTNGGNGVDTDDATGDSIIDEVESAGEDAQAQLEDALRDAGLTSLASAVAQVDLSNLLDDNEFTVFAPNDEAFLALDSDDLTNLLADPARVLELLQNHIVVGSQLTAADLEDEGTVTSEAGATLTVETSGATLTIDGATVTTSETVGDGIFHVIDTVLTEGIIP